MSKKIKIKTCKYISGTDLVPKSWNKWFWNIISENAPFTWGDNNKSMVTASCFANHCQERLDDSLKIKRWLEKVRSYVEMYIDLES